MHGKRFMAIIAASLLPLTGWAQTGSSPAAGLPALVNLSPGSDLRIRQNVDVNVFLIGFGGLLDPATLLAQRVSASGGIMWNIPGVTLTNVPGAILDPDVISDDAGGFIVVWQGTRHGSFVYSAYGQRVSGRGAVLWGDGAIELTTQDWGSEFPRGVPDGHGGVIAVWDCPRRMRRRFPCFSR